MVQVISKLLSMALWGSVVSLVVLAVRPLVKKNSHRIMCLLWAVVMFRFLCPFAIEMPLPALWPEQSHQDTADMVQTQHSLEQFSANAVSTRGNEEEDSISAHDEFVSDMSQSRQETKNPVTTTGAVGTLEKKKHAKENTGLDTKGSSLAVHSETESSVMPNSGMQGTETDHFVNDQVMENRKKEQQRFSMTGFATSAKAWLNSGAGQTVIGILGAIWLIGAGIILMIGGLKYRKIQKILREAIYINEWEKYPVRTSDISGVPMSFGILKPGIYVPVGFEQKEEENEASFSERQKELILWHEAMHLKHHDPLWLIISFVMFAMHWWNPLAWLCVRYIGKDIEMACDEAVLAQIGYGKRGEYAKTLLEFTTDRDKLLPIAAFGETDAESRIKNALRYKKAPVWITVVTLCMVTFLGGCLVTKPTAGKGSDQTENETDMQTAQNAPDDRKESNNSTSMGSSEEKNEQAKADSGVSEENKADDGQQSNADDFVGVYDKSKPVVFDAEYCSNSENKKGTGRHYEERYSKDNLRVPFINIDSEYVHEVNQEIKRGFESAYEAYDRPTNAGKRDYEYYISGNILSVIILDEGEAGKNGWSEDRWFYNINMDTKEQASLEELFRYCGFESLDQLQEKAKIAIYNDNGRSFRGVAKWDDEKETYFVKDGEFYIRVDGRQRSGIAYLVVKPDMDYSQEPRYSQTVTFSSNKVVEVVTKTVKSEDIHEDDTMYVLGKDSSGNDVWRYEMQEISPEVQPEDGWGMRNIISTRKGKVYLSDYSTLYVLDEQTGQVLDINAEATMGKENACFVFDDEDNFYIYDYMMPLQKLDKNGDLIGSVYINDGRYIWPNKLSIQGDELVIECDEGKLTLNRKDLSIIKEE